MSRIKPGDPLETALVKITEGNPGAVTVCMEILKRGQEIDTDAVMAPFTAFYAFDYYSIYGPRIWVLYKDICKTELWKVLLILRALQLGIINREEVHEAIITARQPGTTEEQAGWLINFDKIIPQVTEALHGFKIPAQDQDQGQGNDLFSF